MTVITLARALKLKNRLAGRLTRLGQRAVAHNSRVDTAKKIYDTHTVFIEYADVQAQLVEVKTKIQHGNASIAGKIIQIGELRSEISLLQGMTVTEGPVSQFRISSALDDKEIVHNFVASIGAETRDRQVSLIELDIDNLQDDIDSHNATMKIDLSFDL